MSPEEPGAPDDAQRDTGHTATFRPGVEQTALPGLSGDAPDSEAPRDEAASPSSGNQRSSYDGHTSSAAGPTDAQPAGPAGAPPPRPEPSEPPRPANDAPHGAETLEPPRDERAEPSRPSSADPPRPETVEAPRPEAAEAHRSETAEPPRPASSSSPTFAGAAPATVRDPEPPSVHGADLAPPSAAPEVPVEPEPETEAPRRVVAPTARRRLLDDPDPDVPKGARPPKVRHRKVRRVVRHIEPWSVLKISVLFFASIFLIICVASAVLWNAARSAGAIDDVESFITSLGFGNCEDIDGDTAATPETTTTISGEGPQLGAPSTTDTTVPAPEDERSTIPGEDGKCAEGQRLVGGFKFEDQRIFQSFALFGIVLVLTGAAASVVMALLFNLISDLTGGVRVTVLEEEPVRVRTGSPPPRGDG